MNIKEAILKNKNHALWLDCVHFSQEIALNVAAEALNNGVKIIQYYFTTATSKQNIEFGLKLRQLCSMFEALLVVNSRADIAQVIEADGLCLFKDDMNLSQAKKIFHNDIIFGVCVQSLEDLIYANESSADYICIDSSKIPSLNANLKALNKIKIIELNRKFL